METLLHSRTVSGMHPRDSSSAPDHAISITSPVSSGLTVGASKTNYSFVEDADVSQSAATNSRKTLKASNARTHSDLGQNLSHSGSTDLETLQNLSRPNPDYSRVRSSWVAESENDSYCTANEKEQIAISPQQVCTKMLIFPRQ